MDSLESHSKDPVELLNYISREYGDQAVFTSSFGAEDMVLIDMIKKHGDRIEIASIDTGRLPEDTYQIMDMVKNSYKTSFRIFFPDKDKVQKMVDEYGINLFYKSKENRTLCCNLRKVEPLQRILKDHKIWITGIRRDQTIFRTSSGVLEHNKEKGIIKVNPIIEWKSERVWDYIRQNSVPYNRLHDLGYPSIGCEPCTRAVRLGDDPRSGRWWWEDGQKECGLHVSNAGGFLAMPGAIVTSGEMGEISHKGGNADIA